MGESQFLFGASLVTGAKKTVSMASVNNTEDNRIALQRALFPKGMPKLWCPSLTHYATDGTIDGKRIAAHLSFLAPHVKGFLIPGSTGDAWELSDDEMRELLRLVCPVAQEAGLGILVGALKPDGQSTLKTIHQVLYWLKEFTDEVDAAKSMSRSSVKGFTICPSRGPLLRQVEMEKDLRLILETGLPLALYQLPQVTLNEMSAELVAGLAGDFPNFILFKDTSGEDKVVLSRLSLHGVFTVRGAEGDYARWIDNSGGPYRGFLLSAANCFAAHLSQIMADLSSRKLESATLISARLTSVISEVFSLVKGVNVGNAFANANKAIDHFNAFGPKAINRTPPRLHGGILLPVEIIQATGRCLEKYGLMPAQGYL